MGQPGRFDVSLTQTSSEPTGEPEEPHPSGVNGRDADRWRVPGAAFVSEDGRSAPLLLKAAIFLTFAMVPILRPGLPQNLAFVDPVIMGVCFLSLLWMARQGSPATLGAVRSLPWLWLILVGSYLGLATVGIPLWSTMDLFRGVLAFLTFFCYWHIIHVGRLERYALAGAAAGLVITVVALLVLPFTYRSTAFFEHPNYAGHYAVIAGVVLVAAAKRPWAKAAFGLLIALSLWRTGSFGALAMVLAALGVVGIRSLRRNSGILLIALVVLLVGGIFVLAPVGTDTNPADDSTVAVDDSALSVSSSFNQDRFDKSQGSRFTIWSDAFVAFGESPLGVGPDGVRNRGIGFLAEGGGKDLEIHSDALGYLIERGIIGLIGFIGLWVAIYRCSRPGGLARIVITMVIVAGLFRETMHYRHVWVFLALALVLDARDQENERLAAVLDAPARVVRRFRS